MKIKPTKSFPVATRISMFDVLGNQEHYLLGGGKTNYYILNRSLDITGQFETPYARDGVTFLNPHKPYIAILGQDETLHITDLEGRELWTKPGHYTAACWTFNGCLLYTVLRLDSNTLKLIIYDNSGNVTAQKEFVDELYKSAAILTPIPCSEEMTLQLIAGQDGCSVHFIKLDGSEIAMRMLHENYCYACVSFNQTGTHFLCIENDESSIHHFTYPALEEIGMIKFDVTEGNLDYTLIYLDGQAIFRFCEKFHLLDVSAMKVSDELIIEGHEPIPVCEVYEHLKEDDLICDISYMCSAGSHILGYAARKGKYQMVVIQKDDLKRSCTQ